MEMGGVGEGEGGGGDGLGDGQDVEDGFGQDEFGGGGSENGDEDGHGRGDGFEDEDEDESLGVAGESGSPLEEIRLSYLHDLHTAATDAGVTIFFLGNPAMTLNPSFTPPFSSIPAPAPDRYTLYHGCAVHKDIDDLVSRLGSFVQMRPIIMLPTNPAETKPSYLSTRPAVYYSSSITYARLWPVLKDGLNSYRQIKVLGREFSIIAVSELQGEGLNGRIKDLKCARIPQNDPLLAKRTSSSNFRQLMLEQFANRNTAEYRSDTRKPIKKSEPWTAACDIITSPLPLFEQENLLRPDCLVGRTNNDMSLAKDITMVAGCTLRGANHLGRGIKTYIVYGFGEGTVGYGTSHEDWETSMIVNTVDENGDDIQN
jgi:hypothetical protein